MRLEAESGASFFLSLATEDEERIELSIERAVVVEVRCDEPAWLAPQGQLRLEVHLDAGHLVELLLDAELPEPTGGVIRLDESSAPELLDELIRLLPEAWELRCEGESDEDSNIEDPGGGQDPAPEEGAPEPPDPGGDSGSDE